MGPLPALLPVTGPGLASQADEGEGSGEHPAPSGLSLRGPPREAARRVLGRDWGGEASRQPVHCAPAPAPSQSRFLALLFSVGHAATEGPTAPWAMSTPSYFSALSH